MTDCVTCVVNAFRDSTTGACGCPQNLWGGDSCNVRQYECDANCLECEIDTSDDYSSLYNNCSKCADGYYLERYDGAGNGNFYTCEACTGIGCKTCTNTNGDKCQTCFDGYTLTSSYHCVPCAPNCATCVEGN